VRVLQAAQQRSLVYRNHPDGSTTYEFSGYASLPVYVVDGTTDLGNRETTFVPPGAHCVFVNAQTLPAVLDGFGILAPSAWQRYSARERAAAIAVILLHEAGHLAAGDEGSYGGIGDTPRGVNPTAAIVRREVAADRFATAQIARGLAARDFDNREYLEGGRSLVANKLFYIVQVAWAAHDLRAYMSAQRDAARDSLYRPTELSHLNLHLRFEIMQYQLEPTDERRRQLQAWLGDEVNKPTFAPVRDAAGRYVGDDPPN
jgi:hypothetical protein